MEEGPRGPHRLPRSLNHDADVHSRSGALGTCGPSLAELGALPPVGPSRSVLWPAYPPPAANRLRELCSGNKLLPKAAPRGRACSPLRRIGLPNPTTGLGGRGEKSADQLAAMQIADRVPSTEYGVGSTMYDSTGCCPSALSLYRIPQGPWTLSSDASPASLQSLHGPAQAPETLAV